MLTRRPAAVLWLAAAPSGAPAGAPPSASAACCCLRMRHAFTCDSMVSKICKTKGAEGQGCCGVRRLLILVVA